MPDDGRRHKHRETESPAAAHPTQADEQVRVVIQGVLRGYRRVRIFVTSGRFGIALKLPPQSVQRLLEEPGAKPLRYFPKGHVKRDYVVVPASVLDDGPAIKKLVGQSIRYATRPAV